MQRVERLEKNAKLTGNDQTIYTNYSEEQRKRSMQLLYDVIQAELEESGKGITMIREANIAEDNRTKRDPIVEKIKKDLIDYIDRKEEAKSGEHGN